MIYHYQRGVQHSYGWPAFFAKMFIFDLIAVLLIITGMHWYSNRAEAQNGELLRRWCQQVLCVQIDPVTGIGTPVYIEQQIAVKEI